jgi:hypothetical protein
MSNRLKEIAPRTFLRRIAPYWVASVIICSLWSAPKDLFGTYYDLHALRHRAFHMAVFGLTAVLFLLLSADRRQEVKSVWSVFALGVFLEISQKLIYGTIFEWWDIRDDAVGVFAGFVLVQFGVLVPAWLEQDTQGHSHGEMGR